MTPATITGNTTRESSFVFPPSWFPPSLLFVIRAAWLQGSQRTVRMSQSRLLSSLYTNDREARCLWSAPYHNGRLTSDDTSCATTRFLSWGIGVSWMVIADSLSDLCYNWNKTRIASKTVLPGLKPLSVHRSIIRRRRRQFSLRVGLLTKAVKAQFHPDDTAHLTCCDQHAWLNKVWKMFPLTTKCVRQLYWRQRFICNRLTAVITTLGLKVLH